LFHLTVCLSISQTSIDDTTALDMLSSDFSTVPSIKPSAPDAQHFTPEPTPPTFKVPQTNLHKYLNYPCKFFTQVLYLIISIVFV